MPNAEILSSAEAKFLERLRHHKVKFIVIGLAAAALQGAPIVTQDVDLWFKDVEDPKIKKALRDVGGSYVAPLVGKQPMFAGRHVQLFDIVLNVDGLGSFAKEEKNTILVAIYGTKIPVLKLERIIVSKKAANRQKDKLTLPVLEDALATLKARGNI